MSSGRNRAAFTLLEMLVSLTIIATILAMVYGSFSATTRSIDASRAGLARVERACFALRLMSRQVRCAYAPQPHDTETGSGSRSMFEAAETSARAPSILFRGGARDPRGEVLSFITGSGLGTSPDAPRGLGRVTYCYDRAASTLSVRRQEQAGSFPSPPFSGHPDVLLSNVARIELKFHDGRRWQESWDAVQKHELPRAVKVEITISDEAGRLHSLGTTIPITEETHPEPKNTKRAVAAGQP
jgi:prepilin-type N-terminal cleavage/methylation domain-containing protein